ncbi:ABC transporter ATP-binding protein [Paractinoplanes durhamensis]|uniref:Aliphatic sulfonate ABC transporter ATP-binding protein n=1 Tax=Paractinoplanes durhamensis TaxID=113563 RepID=A0ABQ3YX52_9ACTN|nr:ABC transporter ATP-binding protein [Actinoplanes durhamensis]GIE02095.1 aliphatic sulfonate ABC transporter ATP-binding protein [Actinoplanes durhamensis]
MSTVLAEKITRRYGERTVLHELDLAIERGEFVALLGKSGCGKTTLLRALAGLDPVDGGSLSVPQRRTVVFQEHRLLPWWKVWRNVAIGLPRATARAKAQSALEEVGLANHADAWPVTLSGGEAQRVALARALVREPELLLLDEPFAALDALTRIKMHGLVRDLTSRHRPAVLLVTHDVDESILLADRVLTMRDGRIAAVHEVSATARERGSASFAALRGTLLGELGVSEA